MIDDNYEDQARKSFKVPPRLNLFCGVMSQWSAMAVSIFLGLIVTPFIIRALGNEFYGLWGLVASLVGFYGFFDFGLRSAVARFLGNAIGAKNARDFNRVASTGKYLLAVSSIFIIILALLIIEPMQSILSIPKEYTEQFRLLVILSAANIAISTMMSIYGGALRASEDFVLLSCISVGASITRSLGGLIIVVLAGKGVVGLAAVSVATNVLVQIVIFLRCRARFPQLKTSFSSFDKMVARNLIGFGAAASLVTIAEIVRSKFDIMLVTRFGGLGQAGIYAVAIVVFRYSTMAILNVAKITWPRLNKLQGTGNQNELRVFFLRASHITAACASLLAGLIIGLAPLLFHLWVGQGYEESATVLRILIGGYFLDFATNPGIGSLYATARHRYFAAQTVIEAVMSFPLAFLLGARFGMNGVAMGIVIPITVIKLTFQPWCVARNLSIGFREYWFRVIGMASLAMVVLACGLVPVEYSLARWGWWTAPLMIGTTMAIAGVLLWQTVLDKMDRAHIISRFKRTANMLNNLRSRVTVFPALRSESKDAKQR
jgi:O-antigen/teichoic acid export membrane protein